MSDKKTIVINGKHSCDVFNVKKEHRIRLGSYTLDYDHEQTKSHLLLHDTTCTKAIDLKIIGYKHQDNKKNIHDTNTIISLEEAKQKLIDCDLKCAYCAKFVKVIYSIVRDPLQWTLDRIDNKKNHSNSNTLIACLQCNLKRRNINKEKFEFTQNMTIVKSK